ncbi:putative phosphatidylinositol-3,4,5-trisphosphate 3-phosphatase [Sporobolomyces koalae]|uniref:putative phosphatidylinositol-3,4,5-trisphosphate 3-phosphatase n=1 Tax=Sporobolomyces koalae TaxID=500713 RepID=UPI0031711693
MLNTIRGIVSGRKARYQEDGFDLDLVRITDRMIIMGYPASGLASLYRNKRSDVLKFLEPHAPHYRIFNLCPLYENSYDANEIVHDQVKREPGNHAVERFPWPDHHPPPLSMFRIMVERAQAWYNHDERNVIVIHCKAGKGRSGTFAISILMSLPGLPSTPSESRLQHLDPQDRSDTEQQDQAEGHEASGEGQGTGEAEDSTDPITTHDLPNYTKAEAEQLGMNEKLDWLLKFHTQRRMKPGVKNLGVSISSQRRFLRYWARLLEGDDPRSSQVGPPQRLIVLEYIKVTGDGLKGPQGRFMGVGNDKIAVQVWRYKDSIADDLRKRELAVVRGEQESQDPDWHDRDKMFVHVGGFVETEHPIKVGSDEKTFPDRSRRTASQSTLELPQDLTDEHALETYDSTASTVSPYPPSSRAPSSIDLSRHSTEVSSTAADGKHKWLVPHTSYLAPASAEQLSQNRAQEQVERDGGIVVDGERELMLKFLVGETGHKHGKLPTMAALALSWFIPVFESPPSPSSSFAVLRLQARDLDFVKKFAGIDQVEIGWRWL